MNIRIVFCALAAALAAAPAVAGTGPEASVIDIAPTRSAVAARVGVAAANFAAVPAVRGAQADADECFKTHLTAGDLGDVSNTRLLRLRGCVAKSMAALIERMSELKSLQHAARFDYALFSETARLLTVSDNPAREALDPFVAMLTEARRAAETEAQQILIDELNTYGQGLRAAFEG